ncbi:DNA-processing protein DprA [Corynebacterium sp. 335C]
MPGNATGDPAMTAETRRAWAYLARVVEGPHPDVNVLLGRIGPEELADRIRSRAGLPAVLLRATEARYAACEPEADLAEAADHGFRLTTPEDPDWPVDAIAPFVAVAGEAGAAAPHALWVRGGSPAALLADAVAMVGTRAATAYGKRVAEDFSAGVAAAGTTVVSGGALGIDAACHRGALAAGGRSVAVMACGPGVTYPVAHGELFDRLDAVITEYPPGMRPARHRFLTRNRLVAGLTAATVLVEAGWRSGARNTVHWAERYGRPVGAVPGPVSSASSTGAHACIREGVTLVSSVREVLALCRPIGEIDEDEQLELDWAAGAVQALPRNELRVYDAVPPAGSEGLGAGPIAAECGAPLALTVHLLTALQRRGLVERRGSRWSRT